jgi:hypothetical protein
MIKNDKIISAEILKNLGIYELRELARNLGISSPTTKKRNELCELILKISKGEQKTETKTNKGRPPKSITKISSLLNEFIPEDILKLQKVVETNNNDFEFLTLAQNPLSINKYNEEKQIFGYINSINGHLYVKNLKTYNEFKDLVFYIPTEITQKFSLREGDKILANGKIADSYTCGIIETILKINNKEIGAYEALKSRKSLDLSTVEIFSVNEIFLDTQIKKGDRILTFFKNQEEAIVKVLEEIEKLTDKTIFLGVELAPEVIYYIKTKKNIEAFTTSFYNTLEETFDAVTNSINHANTLLKDGESIKFIIFDIMGILSRLDMYYSNESNKYLNHNVSAIQILKKLIGKGKAFTKNLHLTTISIAFESERNNEFLKTELEKVFSKII